MRAVVVAAGQVGLDRARPVPQPAGGEALIRVLLAGVCATDQAILHGYADFSGILGHEFVGRVEQAPDHPEWVGCRVVGEITVACGRCAACGRRERGHCQHRTVVGIRQRDGVFADWVCLPVVNLHRVPDGVADREALFVEPLAAAVEILQQSHMRPSDRVVVVGAGKLGMLVAQVLALTGCELVVMARHDRQRRLLEARRIAVATEAMVLEGDGADVVVECSGSRAGLAVAQRMVRPGGRIVLKSTHPVPTPVDLAALVVNEVVLQGSRCGPFPAALRLLERKLVAVEPMIEAVHALDDALAALTRSQEPGTLKVVIQP
ncbi:MAG: alcohol dehydrogenase catalytic domain-containing protein [Magnetococcales bacterium]|nr:alcohol dehydrogenase catalytic domain-containing protein [Magnetococcales bacterium]